MTIRDSYVEQIHLLENALKMYDKTRDEMITHGAEISSLEKIDAEIDRISVDLSFYQNLLNKLDNNVIDNTCNCNGYTEGCSSSNCKSKDYELKDGKVYYRTSVNKEENVYVNNLYNELINNDKADTFIPVPQNRFLVKFPKDVDLNTQDVLSINDSMYGDYNVNGLNIVFREFERENFCLPYLLTKLIKDRVKFNIIVETLKPNLDVLYVTEYVDVRFTQFTSSDKDYSSDGINKYIVKSVFDDVKYYIPFKNETSCKEG